MQNPSGSTGKSCFGQAFSSRALLWSAIHPRDRLTWLLEVAPALLAILVLALSYSRFKLTPLAYWLILLHSVILMIGGHYTYAEVPAFNWLRIILTWLAITTTRSAILPRDLSRP